MDIPTRITPGTKVEVGELGTPSHKIGLVLGIDVPALDRQEDDPSALVSWEGGEQEWVQLSQMRVTK